MYFLLKRGCRLTREKLLGQAGSNEADQLRPTDPRWPSILAHTLPTLPLPVCTTSSCYCTPPMIQIIVYIYINKLINFKTQSEIIPLLAERMEQLLACALLFIMLTEIIHSKHHSYTMPHWPKISENKWAEVCLFNVDIELENVADNWKLSSNDVSY